MNCGIREQRLERGGRLGVEILNITIQRHRQDRIDLAPGVHGRARHQQIRALRHARHDPQLGVGQAKLQFGQEFVDLAADPRHCIGAQIAMTGDADDEG